MGLKVISIDNSEIWDGIVKSFINYDIYYLSGYVKAFQLHGDGYPLLFYFEEENLRAINVVIRRDICKDKNFNDKIPENTYFDLTTPYGYGGFLIEGDNTNVSKLEESYQNYCKNNRIICEFVRFHPVLENVKWCTNIYEIRSAGNTVCIELKDQGQIWDNISSKNRNMIRKAKKSGLKVFWGRDEWLIPEFIKIYNTTMNKDCATNYYYFSSEFYESILFLLKNNALFFYTKLKEEIVSISIILFCNKQLHYHLSGVKKDYQNLAPTNLLLYEASCFGAEMGFRTFHLGGGLGAKNDNLYKFKKSFNRNEDKCFFVGNKIFNCSKYTELVEMRSKQEGRNAETNYFPSYRE